MNLELRARFELVFGNICSVPEPRGQRAVEISVDRSTFARLLKHWGELPLASRPHLRGLTLARSGERPLQLILDAGGRTPFILLTADQGGARKAPNLSAVWPFAAWWEDELRSFEKMDFDGGSSGKEIAWRQN